MVQNISTMNHPAGTNPTLITDEMEVGGEIHQQMEIARKLQTQGRLMKSPRKNHFNMA
jgi:hypothetical protein